MHEYAPPTPGYLPAYIVIPDYAPSACLLLFCVYTVYTMINAGLAVASGAADKVTLGVEPILFGLLYLGFDQLFIAIKHRIVRALGKETADA